MKQFFIMSMQTAKNDEIYSLMTQPKIQLVTTGQYYTAK